MTILITKCVTTGHVGSPKISTRMILAHHHKIPHQSKELFLPPWSQPPPPCPQRARPGPCRCGNTGIAAAAPAAVVATPVVVAADALDTVVVAPSLEAPVVSAADALAAVVVEPSLAAPVVVAADAVVAELSLAALKKI